MAVKPVARTVRHLAEENEELRLRLEEAEETLRAIRAGEVDALVVSTREGEQVFTLHGADRTYRTLIEEMNEGALDLTKDGMILYANRRFAEMLKAPLESVIGSHVQAWVEPDCRAEMENLLRDGIARKRRGELSLRAADQTAVPVYLSVNPSSADASGDRLGAVATDLTDQKQAEQALRLSEAKFRRVFQNVSLGKSLRSLDGDDQQVNSEFLAILGYSEEELKQKAWQELTHPDDAQLADAALNALMEGRLATARFESRLIHKDGHPVWADVTLSLVRNEAGQPQYVLGTFYDISARKEADAALEDLKNHLQRNIEIERLHLAQDLHDVPLQQLYGIIYRLEELRLNAPAGDAETVGEVIDDLKQALNSMRVIASELRPPAASSFKLESAVRTYVKKFREQHSDIVVSVSLPPQAKLLPESTRLVLFRALQESFSNAARHAHATEISAQLTFEQDEARLEIVDNGQGFKVPDDWLSSVRSGHYGLAGLAERVKAADGRFEVISAPGFPTTVRVVLPSIPPAQ